MAEVTGYSGSQGDIDLVAAIRGPRRTTFWITDALPTWMQNGFSIPRSLHSPVIRLCHGQLWLPCDAEESGPRP